MAKERPFFLIAHRCNNKGDVEMALAKGANAFECDVRYGKKKEDWCVNHDAYRPKVSMSLCNWLKEVYQIDDKGKICFLMLDVKSTDYLDKLISYVHEHTDELITERGKPIPVVYSIARLKTAKKLLPDKIASITDWEGVSVDYGNDPTKVNKFFCEIQKKMYEEGRKEFGNFIYGDGINAGFADTEERRKRLKSAGTLRDTQQVIKKTYTWTIEKQSTAERYLDIGVDGILTNAGGGDVPRDRIKNIINAIKAHNKNHPDKKVRYATATDNVFEVFK